jgi:hypothetical protein
LAQAGLRLQTCIVQARVVQARLASSRVAQLIRAAVIIACAQSASSPSLQLFVTMCRSYAH